MKAQDMLKLLEKGGGEFQEAIPEHMEKYDELKKS